MTSPPPKRADGSSPSALFVSPPPGGPPGLVARWADARWLDADGPCLSADEAQEAAAMGARRRAAFVLGRTLARRVLADVLGVPARAVPLARGADGRVVVPDLHVSLTHTHDASGQAVAGVAVARVPVGIDAEPVRPRTPDLAARILADGEALPAWPSGDAARLLAAWTAKEAALKADGLGLRRGARASRLAWADGGAFTAATPGGRWAGQGAERSGLVWAVAWAVGTSAEPRSHVDKTHLMPCRS